MDQQQEYHSRHRQCSSAPQQAVPVLQAEPSDSMDAVQERRRGHTPRPPHLAHLLMLQSRALNCACAGGAEHWAGAGPGGLLRPTRLTMPFLAHLQGSAEC